MKKRLSLAIALIHEPEILILDEPTVGIDPLLRKTIWEKFYDLKKKGTTIIVTTHIMDEAEFCERLGLIREGKLVATGEPEELKSWYHQDGLKMSFVGRGGPIMRVTGVIIRIIRQFFRDKRSLAMMFGAPMLLLWLLSLVFTQRLCTAYRSC